MRPEAMGTFSMIGNREQLDAIPPKVTAHIANTNAGTVRYSKHLRQAMAPPGR